ncbi:hypothetical protein FNJ07_09685 [Salmonella enterica subsp. salamae]|nr:hypothetical protein [Salmonella enterica subsp. salamae]ECJ2335016.1 hypothetical protein [Salmonella enterica subsp. salamae]
MEGFLRGKCIPGDLKVNETNAEYLVRKFSEAEERCAVLSAKLSMINDLMKAAEQANKLAQEATENLVQERNALAAENTALKKSEVEFNEYCRRECENVGDTWVDDFTETPATDAFLAEIRAQFWVEGNEPTEFGRYWVRYETDVGPLYCSARWLEHNFCAGSDTNIHRIWLADHSRSINSLRGVTHYTKLPDSLEGGAQ